IRSKTNCEGVIHSTGKGTASPSLPTGVALTIRSTFRTSSESEPNGAGPPLLTSRSRQTARASSRSRLATPILGASVRRGSADAPGAKDQCGPSLHLEPGVLERQTEGGTIGVPADQRAGSMTDRVDGFDDAGFGAPPG